MFDVGEYMFTVVEYIFNVGKYKFRQKPQRIASDGHRCRVPGTVH